MSDMIGMILRIEDTRTSKGERIIHVELVNTVETDYNKLFALYAEGKEIEITFNRRADKP